MMNAANTLTRAAVTLERKPLADALKVLCKVVEKRNTIPVLSTLRVRVAPSGIITLQGSDLDVEVAIDLEGADAAPGLFLIDCHALKATLAKMKGTRVRIGDGGDFATLTDITSGATLRLTNACDRDAVADFPQLEGAPSHAGMTLPAAQVRDDFGRCLAAVSYEETRYYLNGIYCHLTNGDDAAPVLRMATTDGHRLVRVTRAVPADIGDNLAQGETGVILPRKAAALIRDIIGTKPAGDIALAFSPLKFTFACGAVTMRGKLIDGTFPDYARVIPSARDRGVNIGREALADVVGAVTAHCTDKLACVTIGAAAAGWFTAAGCDAESGIAGAQVNGVQVLAPVTADGCTRIETGFAGKYVLDMTNKVFADVDTLSIRFEDAAAPAAFYSDAAPHVLAVQMPKRGAAALDPAGVRALNPAAAAPEPVVTPEHVQEAAAATDPAPVDVPALVEAPSPAPEPAAANDDAAAPVEPLQVQDVPGAPITFDGEARLAAACADAVAALDAAGVTSAADDAAADIWLAFVTTFLNLRSADEWAWEGQGKQRDRKARNRGKVMLSGACYRFLVDAFNDLAPFQEAAAAPVDSPALPCPVETATPEPVASPCPPAAAAAPEPDAIAALAARLAVLERAAGITTARPPRSAAHIRAIRAYLKARAARTRLHAAAVSLAELLQETQTDLSASRDISIGLRTELEQSRTNEAAVRKSVQVQAVEQMRLEENIEFLRDGITAAEVETAQVRATLASLQVTAAADRAELERLAPVVSALAALNRPALAA